MFRIRSGIFLVSSVCRVVSPLIPVEKHSIGTRKNFLSYIVCRIRSSFTEDFERTDPNEPDYFETIYPSIHSMVKQVAFWSNYFDKQTQNAKNTIFPVTDDATAASGFGFFRRQKSCTQKSFPKEGIYLPALSIAWEINSSLLKSAPCFSCSFSMSLFRLFVRLITWA